MPSLATAFAILMTATGQPTTPSTTSTPATAPENPAPIAAPTPGSGDTSERQFATSSGLTLSYSLILPPAFDPLKTYPMLLALPPGNGSESMVNAALGQYWSPAAASRGWVVISPHAPGQDAAAWKDHRKDLLELLDGVTKTMRPEQGLFHLAGVSNGGLAAFSLAIDEPGRFASLLVLPGAPADADAFAHLDRLRTVPVTMLVGGADAAYWLPAARDAAQRLEALHQEIDLRVLPGQGHVLKVDSGTLFDILDRSRPEAKARRQADAAAKARIARALDDFHDAAAKADEVRYFEHFAPDAVFLGTDGTERWTLPQFRAFAAPIFQRGTGWTYTPTGRAIFLAPQGDVAWFDESLSNTKYGPCRGSGVLVKVDGEWRIAQYNLSKPVPNHLMKSLVDLENTQPPPANNQP